MRSDRCVWEQGYRFLFAKLRDQRRLVRGWPGTLGHNQNFPRRVISYCHWTSTIIKQAKINPPYKRAVLQYLIAFSWGRPELHFHILALVHNSRPDHLVTVSTPSKSFTSRYCYGFQTSAAVIERTRTIKALSEKQPIKSQAGLC